MAVEIHDTLHRSIQTLPAPEDRPLRFYCCGPTVYGPAHIGNFRTFLLQDVLRRTIEADGTPVHHVRNITDVDDKTIQRSHEEGVALSDFTARWAEKFRADCAALNMLPPSDEPSAVAHVPLQIELIQRLMDRGHAYVGDDGSVYFRIASFPPYGRLSNLTDRELRAQGDGGNVGDADEYDRESVSDFALWKRRKPEDGDNHWESPWGEGRPGWHLECSAMAENAFGGETIDLHGGGIDLCFPHHENEIAQSEAARGRTFCRRWFHVAHLLVEGRKMAKSLGNLYTLDDLREKGLDPMAVRYTLIAGSYRHPLNFTLDGVHASASALAKLERFAEGLLQRAGETQQNFPGYVRPAPPDDFGALESAWNALRHNLNTPACLGAIFGVVGSDPLEQLDAAGARRMLRALGVLLYGLGLDLFTAPSDEAAPEVPEEVARLAEERWAAKKEKDFARADALRDRIREHGWTVKDRKDGYDLVPRS